MRASVRQRENAHVHHQLHFVCIRVNHVLALAIVANVRPNLPAIERAEVEGDCGESVVFGDTGPRSLQETRGMRTPSYF